MKGPRNLPGPSHTSTMSWLLRLPPHVEVDGADAGGVAAADPTLPAGVTAVPHRVAVVLEVRAHHAAADPHAGVVGSVVVAAAGGDGQTLAVVAAGLRLGRRGHRGETGTDGDEGQSGDDRRTHAAGGVAEHIAVLSKMCRCFSS